MQSHFTQIQTYRTTHKSWAEIDGGSTINSNSAGGSFGTNTSGILTGSCCRRGINGV